LSISQLSEFSSTLLSNFSTSLLSDLSTSLLFDLSYDNLSDGKLSDLSMDNLSSWKLHLSSPSGYTCEFWLGTSSSGCTREPLLGAYAGLPILEVDLSVKRAYEISLFRLEDLTLPLSGFDFFVFFFSKGPYLCNKSFTSTTSSFNLSIIS